MSNPSTVGDVLEAARRQLNSAKIDSAHLDARLLLEAVLGVSAAEIIGHPENPISPDQISAFEQMIDRRTCGEPVSRIIGHRAFWRGEFVLSPETLDPRADSETLLDAALSYFKDRPPPGSILDLGTGSGCLLISLLQEFPDAYGIGVDISPGAVRTATLNAQRLDVTARCLMICGNWAAALSGRFDLVVSNPPYINRADIKSLDREVQDHDPVAALDGGDDGLRAYREIIPEMPQILTAGGAAILEFGRAQGADIAALVDHENMQVIEIYRDISNMERCILATIGAVS